MDEKMAYLTKDDMYRLPPDFLANDNEMLNREFIRKKSGSYFSARWNIRAVKHFLNDLHMEIKRQLKKYNSIESFHAHFIAFLFIKHFMPEFYDELKKGKLENELVDCFFIDYKDNQYSLPDFFQVSKKQHLSDEEVQNVFDPRMNPLNFQKYIAFCLFDLKRVLDVREKSKLTRTELEKKSSSDVAEHIYGQEKKELIDEEEIDYSKLKHIVYHLLGAGDSIDNAYIEMANKFAAVLSENDDIFMKGSEDGYAKVNKELDKIKFDMYQSDRTIFRIAIAEWTQIFKAYFLAEEEWSPEEICINYKRLISLFFLNPNVTTFDFYVVKNLNACWEGLRVNGGREPMLLMMEKICRLKIVGNMNAHEAFKKFQARSLGCIYYFGYLFRQQWEIDEYFSGNVVNDSDADGFLFRLLRELKDYADVFRQNGWSDSVADYDVLVGYMEKLLDIRKPSERIKDTTIPTMKTEIHDIAAETMQHIEAIADDEQFQEELKRAQLLPVQQADMLKRRFSRRND